MVFSELNLTGSKRFSLINQGLGMIKSLKQGKMSRLLAAIRLVESCAPAGAIPPLNLPQRYLHSPVIHRDDRAHGSYCIAAHSDDVEKCKQRCNDRRPWLRSRLETRMLEPG